MKPISNGCRAIVIGGKPPNRGTIVTVGKFIGEVDTEFGPFEDKDMWEVDRPMVNSTPFGGEFIDYTMPESRLRRLPDESTTTWSHIQMTCGFKPNEFINYEAKIKEYERD